MLKNKRSSHKVITKPEQARKLASKPNIVYVYFMDNCPYCIEMKPAWEEAKKRCKDKHTVEINRIYLNELPATLNDVRGFPTVFAFDDKMNKILFDSSRTVSNLCEFINRYG